MHIRLLDNIKKPFVKPQFPHHPIYMSEPSTYRPPFSITSEIVSLVASISETVGKLTALTDRDSELRLRRVNRIRTIRGSLAIEGNTLSEAQITAILEGKRVIAPPREIQEVKNALAAYERFDRWMPNQEKDLLAAHGMLMQKLIREAGVYRQGGVSVMAGERVIHMAPPARQAPQLMGDLLGWLSRTDVHPLIGSSVFHYEFEFIHPFADGNGRMGRLWQTLILARWNTLFSDVPVESMVFKHQAEYYAAILESTGQTDSAPFISFMLRMIQEALTASTPQVTPQVALQVTPQHIPQVTLQATPQVGELLSVLKGEMRREDLQLALGLRDRKSFRERYLKPALDGRWIERTHPDRPNSPLQKYRLTAKGLHSGKEGRTR